MAKKHTQVTTHNQPHRQTNTQTQTVLCCTNGVKFYNNNGWLTVSIKVKYLYMYRHRSNKENIRTYTYVTRYVHEPITE
jgi:hypothetical protein